MKKERSRCCILQFAFSAGLAVFCCWVTVPQAMADDLSSFSVVLQRGDTSYPNAIVIAPNGRWFLTARRGESPIHVSDLESGAVLRVLFPPGALRRVAISKDGRTIFARYIPHDAPDDNGPEQVAGWNAETGRPVAQAETAAPMPDDPSWNWVDQKWPDTNGPPYDFHFPKKYLFDQKIEQLVDVDRVESVEATNRRDVVQVTLSGEQYEGDNAFAAYHYYFIDIIQKKIVVELSGKTLNTFCGQPHGAFAFNGRYLIIAPTELDASSSFINSMVVDTEAKPPLLKWSRPCQDWQVSAISMGRGLIVIGPQPDKERVWDPATARPLAVLDDIDEIMTWSRDRTTFASGFRDDWNPSRPKKFGVSLLRFGKKFFIPTDQEVKEIRFNPNGSTVFAQTEAGWAAWGTSTGKRLPTDAIPPPENGDFCALDSNDVMSPDGKFRIVHQRQLIDVATGRILVEAPYLNLSSDSRYVWAASDVSSITVWDVASGKKLWTATGNDVNGEDFLFIQFPDGRVRLSRSAEKLVKLVRGFQVRPFDGAARRAFVRP
jgi:WD40 repeat protein